MKNKFLFILLAILTFISCDSELEFLPEDQLNEEGAFLSGASTRGVLIGTYSAAQQDNAFGGTPQLMGEWQSDNVDFVGSFLTFNDIKNYTTLSDNGSIFTVWDDHYEVIGNANLVIAYAPGVEDPNFTAEEKANIVAQAKFLRALSYFNLSNWWAQPIQVAGGDNLAVPLVLEPFEEEMIDYPARASLSQVQAQIEQDLLEAIPDLTDGDKALASAGAAQALLARLYLYQERWNEAADYANRVIGKDQYVLANDYTFYDNPSSSEHVFTIVNTVDDGQNTGQGFSGLTNPVPEGRGDTPFSDDLLDAYAEEAGDLRFSTLTQMGEDASGTGAIRTFTNKFPDGINNSDDAPIIRITELYLIRAEANLRDGSNVGDTPLNDINLLRTRAGLPDLLAVDVTQVLNERRKELCFEGHRRMDLLRNGLNLRRPGMPNEAESAPGQDKVIFPIPVNELDLNENLVQNPGY